MESLHNNDSYFSLAKGRTPPLSNQLTLKVKTALSLANTGLCWADAAAEVGMSTKVLRKCRHHPDSQPFLERVVTENLVCTKNTALSKAIRMIDICAQKRQGHIAESKLPILF